MSYSGSESNSGLGTTISINTGTLGSPTWTLIGELIESPWTGRKNASTAVTNFQSTAAEFIPTLPTSGDVKLTGNYLGTDAGQIAVEAAFDNRTRPQFKVQIPVTGTQGTTGDSWIFVALVEEWNPLNSLSPEKAIQFAGSLKISGGVSKTAGS